MPDQRKYNGANKCAYCSKFRPWDVLTYHYRITDSGGGYPFESEYFVCMWCMVRERTIAQVRQYLYYMKIEPTKQAIDNHWKEIYDKVLVRVRNKMEMNRIRY